MADTTWREIRANFGPASQSLESASQAMSRAGDVFGRMRESLQRERQAQIENDIKQRQLNEQIRQFDISSGLAERKFGEDVRQFGIEERGRQLGRQLTAAGITQEVPAATLQGLGLTSPRPITTSSGSTYDLNTIINNTSNTHSLPASLLSAVISTESAGDPNAVSSKGARGLMQLMPGTARDMGITNINDPIQNIEGGSRYLRQQLDNFGNLEDALAAYNWGPENMRKYIAGGRTGTMPEETRNYITTVMSRLNPQDVSTTGQSTSTQPVVQNIRDNVMQEREATLASVQNMINSPNVTPEDKELLRKRYNQINTQAPTQASVPATRRAMGNRPNPTDYTIPTEVGTPNSPLLGLPNPYQDQIDANTARGSISGASLRENAEKRNKEIAEKEQTERLRRFNNDLTFWSWEQNVGSPNPAESSRAVYESEYIRATGKKPDTNPFDRAVELEEKDAKELEKIRQNNEAAIKDMHSKLAKDGKWFLENRVHPDYRDSYENNLRLAVANKRLFGDITTEDAMIGGLARAIFINDMGDKTGWIFSSRDDKFATTAFGISDEAATALQRLATFDPSVQSLDEMNPEMQTMYNELVNLGLIPKDIQNKLSATTRERRDIRETETARQRAVAERTAPENTKARERELERRVVSAGQIEPRLANITRGGYAPDLSNVIQEEFSRIATPGARLRIEEQRIPEKLSSADVQLFSVDTTSRLMELDRRVNSIIKQNKSISTTNAVNKALRELRDKYKS